MEHIIPFLKKLKKNNNKAWFDAHRGEYESAKAEFEVFITEIVNGLKKFDKSIQDIEPKKTIFRIYRDVRFSKDKTPYKSHFGAAINPGGKKIETPGYYVHVAPGECFVIAGIYVPETETLNKIRQEIEYHLPEFKKILSDKKFKKLFGGIYTGTGDEAGIMAKNPPRGFDKDSPAMEFLKFKSYMVEYIFDEKKIASKNLSKELVEVLKVSLPFNKFLRRAID